MAAPPLLQPEQRVLSTMEASGKRRWIFPRLAPGRFLRARRIVAYALILTFTALPYIPINGKPALLLDVIHRRFTFLGQTFLPTDGFLLALLMVALLLSVFLVTALFGRVWCGWACPQTVYLEFVYRPIERLFEKTIGYGGKPKRDVAGWRKLLRYALYLLVSMFLAHTFLAYFVGVESLLTWIRGSPAQHPVAFAVMTVTTGLMMFDFCYWREQLCIIGCPYGRFQSVLLDRQSLIISYDPKRGEPRGKIKRQRNGDVQLPVMPAGSMPGITGKTPPAPGRVRAAQEKISGDAEKTPGRERDTSGGAGTTSGGAGATSGGGGDCVDCMMCVQVCPTGIDIRDGLQLECVNCAQCIDACDTVMTKVGRPTGLIRYSSQEAIDGVPTRLLRPRVIVYPVLILLILAGLGAALSSQAIATVAVMRNRGAAFYDPGDGRVANAIRVEIANRSDQTRTFTLTLVDQPDIEMVLQSPDLTIGPGTTHTEQIQFIAPRATFTHGTHNIAITVSDGHDYEKTVRCRLLGPTPPPGSLPRATDTRK